MQFCMRALRRVVLTSIALVLAMFVVTPAHGQAAAVTGTVVDGKTGQPLADAQVAVEGADTRVRTNIRGEFRINASAGARLVVTRVGYQATTVTAGTGALRVALTEYAVKLDEVVVTGTVGDSRTRTLGNAIGKVDMSTVTERAPVPKLQDALSVNIPGVRVMRAAGSVGSGGVTRIRGAGSLSLANEPLIFVDGVRVNNQAASFNQAFRGSQEQPSRINDFNPEEIESIEVLKGPSAATIYGTEASNGVIQITTKRGRAGRPTFDMRLDAGASWLANPDGRYPSNYYYSQVSHQVQEFDVLKFNKENGFGSPFSTGTPWGVGASLNGGTESVRYHISGDWARDEGAVDYNWQNKFSGRANIGYTSPKFSVDASMGYLRSKLRGASTAQPITTSILWACNFGSGSGLGGSCEPNPASPDNTGWNDEGHGYQFYRPEDYDGVEGYDNIDRATLSIRLTHNPTSWFRHNLTVGPDYTNDKSSSLIYRYPTARRPFFAASNGEKTARQLRSTFLTVDYGASADLKASSNLTFTTSAGAQYYYKQFDEVVGQGTTFSIPGPSDVTGATTRIAAENFNENKTLGFYAQEQVNIKDRVFLTAAIRADDNSAFGSNFSAAFYPKFAASWVVKESDQSGFLSQLRVRGAWGRAGQQPDVFSAIQTYNPVVGYNGQGGVTPQNIGNPDLKPEIGEEFEAGFDAGLWKGKVGIEFTYYDKKVKDAILSLPIKPSRGFPGNQFTNIGGTKNNGIEVALDVSPVNSEDFGLDFRWVYASNHSEITDLGGTPPAISPGGGSFIQQYYVQGYAPAGYWYKEVVSSTITTVPVGGVPLPIGVSPMCKGGTLIEGSSILGVADGSVVPCAQAPQLYQGTPTPTWSGSFSTNVRIGKHLQLLGVVDYLGGHTIQVGDVTAIHQFFLSSKQLLEGSSEVLAGMLGSQILLGDGGQTWGMAGQFKGGFAKLRTVAATYDLPASITRIVGASRGSITMAGENLAELWRAQKSSYGVDWVDAEVTPNRANAGPANGTYTQESWPQLMRFRTTIRLTF